MFCSFTFHYKFNFIKVNCFFFKQNTNHSVHFFNAWSYNFLSVCITTFNYFINFTVNFGCSFFAISNLILIISAQENFIAWAKIYSSKFGTHTPFCNHFSCNFCCPFNVVRCTCRNIFYKYLFSNPSTKHHSNVIYKFVVRHMLFIFIWST